MSDDRLAVAEHLFAAIEVGDIATAHDLYAPDAEIWHNHDGVIQTRNDNARVLRWMARHLTDIRYEDVRRSVTATGFVQQHVMRAATPEGQRVEIPACIVCTCRDGRITRLDEYLDSAHIGPLTGR